MAAQNTILQGTAPGQLVRGGSWLARNWKWLLLVVFLSFVLLVLGIFLLIMGEMRSSDVAKEAVATAQTNPLIVQHLGAPLEEGWMMSGSINVASGGTGDADLAVPVTGPKGKATLYMTARKSAGVWKYSVMEIAIEGSDQRINLLSEATPSAEAQPTPPETSLPTAEPTPASPVAAPPAVEQADFIQSQETNQEGVVGELTECQRHEGVLTIKVRFRNTSSKPGHLTFTHWNASGPDNAKFYVTAGNKKYFMLSDTDGTVLSTNSTGNGVETDLAPGRTFLWWAKYPAPPAEAKKVNFVTPLTTPFEDVPVTDK